MMEINQCEKDLSPDLSDEQKNWYCTFKRLFGKDYESNIEFLKACECYEEKYKNWKQIIIF